MKMSIKVKHLLCTLFILVPAIGLSATVKHKKVFIGLSGAYTNFSDYSNQMAPGFSLGYKVTKNICLRLDSGFYKVDSPQFKDSLNTGKVDIVPVQLSLAYYLTPGKSFSPYLFAGAGHYKNTFTLDNNIVSGYSGIGITVEEELENKTGFHAGAGFDFHITSGFAFGIEAQYIILEANGSASLSDAATGIGRDETFDVNLNHLKLTVQTKILF